MATIPPNITDGRTLDYLFHTIHTPLEVLVSVDPNDPIETQGWVGATGYYFGGKPYQGDDSGDYRVIPVAGRRNHAVQITSTQTSAYSVQIEGSLDGVTWSNVQLAYTTDGLYNFTGLYKFVRFHVTAITLTVAYNIALPYGLKISYLALAD